MKWNILQNITWKDWVRIILAIDIASVGISMILGFDFHALALLLGSLTKVIFGIGYIFIAVYLFRQVFLRGDDEDENLTKEHLDSEFVRVQTVLVQTSNKIYSVLIKLVDNIHTKLDDIFDRGETLLKEKAFKSQKKVKGGRSKVKNIP
ncbi:MAG: hypothetical protein PHC89_02590 [Candidatus Pacebacteria bacterium]|nr:hypothetical protein [Candidatus Paceibacterota bacterium]